MRGLIPQKHHPHPHPRRTRSSSPTLPIQPPASDLREPPLQHGNRSMETAASFPRHRRNAQSAAFAGGEKARQEVNTSGELMVGRL